MKVNSRSIVIVGLLSLAITVTAQTSTNSWIAGNGKWETNSNWSLSEVPSTNDVADLITNAGNNAVEIDEVTVDPSGFSNGCLGDGYDCVCSCQPNALQVTVHNIFTFGDTFFATLPRVDYGHWEGITNSELWNITWNQDSTNSGWWVTKICFGLSCDGYIVEGTSPDEATCTETIAGWTGTDGRSWTINPNGSGCQYWTPPNYMTISNLLVSAPVGDTNILGVVEASPVPLVVNGNLTVEGNGYLDISQASVFVTNSATGLGYVSIGIDGTNATMSLPFEGSLYDQMGCIGCSSNYDGTPLGNGASNVAYVGTGSIWNNVMLQVGQYGRYNQLTIDEGGEVDASGSLTIGDDDVDEEGPSAGGYNTIIVGGPLYPGAPTSLLSIPAGGIVGIVSPGNELIVTNGGRVVGGTFLISGVLYSSDLTMGSFGAVSNLVLVTGSGSILTNLAIDINGTDNQLIISGGGKIYGLGDGSIGSDSLGTGHNTVLVTGTGSVWGMSVFGSQAYLAVGPDTAGNQLTVAAGALVYDDYAVLGDNFAYSTQNIVVVTDTGSVWSNTAEVDIGVDSGLNTLIITNGGHVYSQIATMGYGFDASPCGIDCNSNLALVAGSGSIWGNQSNLVVGIVGSGNQLIITNGGLVYNGHGYIGLDNNGPTCFGPISNAVFVVGSGSVWSNSGNLYLGYAASTNQLIISTGGSVVASNAYIGFQTNSVGNQMVISNASLTVNNTLDVRDGALTFNGGTMTVNQLVITNSIGTMSFIGGTLTSGGTTVSNGLQFVVGNGTNAATAYLTGTQTFYNGLRIKSNAVVHTCGTITGGVTIDPGGQQVCP